MIRDARTFVAVNVIGALASLFLIASWTISPPKRPLFPAWLLILLGVVMLCGFVYQIVMRLSGRPVPVASWARAKTDRQIWTVKLVVLASLTAAAIAMILYRLCR